MSKITSRRFSKQKNDVQLPLGKENMKTWNWTFRIPKFGYTFSGYAHGMLTVKACKQ